MSALQPHDFDAERAVLGALLLSDRAMYALVLDEGLSAAAFYSVRHRHVFAAMKALFDEGEPFDRLTVRARMQQDGVFGDAGGDATLDEVGSPVVAAGNVRQYARIVRRHAETRAVLRLVTDIQEKASAGTAGEGELIADLERGVLNIAVGERHRAGEMIDVTLQREQDELWKRHKGEGGPAGIPTGWPLFDKQLGGCRRGTVTVIAARPAMGKSVFALNIAEQVAMAGNGVGLFQLEMTKAETAQRLISRRAKVNLTDVLEGRITERQWGKIVEQNAELSQKALHVDDTRGLTISALRAKARQLATRMQLDMIIVDYLQLIPSAPGADNRVQAISEITMGLKILSGELDCAVIVLSQLSRQLEQRVDKHPQLSDLRDSGTIEQDADNVVFIYRPHYYDSDADQTLAEGIIAKARMGERGTVDFDFYGEFQDFRDRRPAPVGTYASASSGADF